MTTKRLRKYSLVNLIFGYLGFFVLILLVLLNRHTEDTLKTLEIADDDLFNGVSPERVVVHSPRGVIATPDPDIIVEHGEAVTFIDNPSRVVLETDSDRRVYQDKLTGGDIHNEKIIHGDHRSVDVLRGNHGRVYSDNDGFNAGRKDDIRALNHDDDTDFGLLDRRLADKKDYFGSVDIDAYNEALAKDEREKEKSGLNTEDGDLDLGSLGLVRDDFDIEELDLSFGDTSEHYGVGKGGELYAYNFPSQGVGAGIGSAGLGAGAGGGAGLGAGIGEGLLNGEAVPTLGGIGDGAKNLYGEPVNSAGVGGLVGGAGAGGAAGLTQGYITKKLGMGVGVGNGIGAGGAGHHDGHYDYDHLPQNGALHIMIHVDGSGSILATRRQLDIMKDTLLKEALLPYYNNDEDLYNKRVTIIDDSGERTLQFFEKATKKDNVLAVAFQDEAAPDYHLPNFNKKPQDAYSYDLNGLKNGLRNYQGLYRGIMFQVDRGRVFSKSFKEMVQCAWNGEGYLSQENLKQYHRDNNLHNIKNKKGVVFSDEYHAKSEGDPQYYLDLLFKASQKVGLDLNIHRGGLTDGKYIKTNQ